jgi:hypothetical protein
MDAPVDVCDAATKVDDRQAPLENACHEGNYTLRNMLSAARADESAAADVNSK